MDQNRCEDGRVNANLLEEKLLSQDEHAFKKEGVDQFRQYLMKARENGIPIKFDGDQGGLFQVWFKGHKDLVRDGKKGVNSAAAFSLPFYHSTGDCSCPLYWHWLRKIAELC
jgi:hypothetical protein